MRKHPKTSQFLVTYVKSLAEMAPSPEGRLLWEYIRDKGEYFRSATHSSVLSRGSAFKDDLGAKLKECYWNAQMLTVLLSGLRNLRYYEGFGDAGIGVPVSHAWNVYNGKVIDITWENLPLICPKLKLENFEYFGVEIPVEYIRKMNPIKRRVAEMLLPYYLEETVNSFLGVKD